MKALALALILIASPAFAREHGGGHYGGSGGYHQYDSPRGYNYGDHGQYHSYGWYHRDYIPSYERRERWDSNRGYFRSRRGR